MLFVSQAVAVAFYVIGFTEALLSLVAPPGSELIATLTAAYVPQFISCGMISVLFFVTFKGADMAMRAQYAILALLLLSVAAFIIGGILEFDGAQFAANAKPDSLAPGYFLGVSLVRQGRLMEARQVWIDTLATGPEDAAGRAAM